MVGIIKVLGTPTKVHRTQTTPNKYTKLTLFLVCGLEIHRAEVGVCGVNSKWEEEGERRRNSLVPRLSVGPPRAWV